MLDTIDLSISMDKEKFKTQLEALIPRLGKLQRDCKAWKIPVIILFEGFDAAGKGTLINELSGAFDPRGYQVFTTQRETLEEKMHPFLWRFFTRLPENGRIAVFDHSWYRRVLTERFHEGISKEKLSYSFNEINDFEKLLTDDGAVIIKFFLTISQKEQAKRLKKLADKKSTAWRVREESLKQNRHYQEYLKISQEMMEKTETQYAPWTIVESTDRRYATIKILAQTAFAMEMALKKKQEDSKKERVTLAFVDNDVYSTSVLSGVELNKSYTKEEYKERLKELQKKLSILHSKLYKKRVPVVLAFEGWDAGGKGGAIKRLTQALDPRGYVVNPVASPNDIEKNHHYLWRFWNNMPKDGHIAIFDRSWYGRVMVERLEGFCTTDEWKRAYKEMNDMEANLTNHGAIVIKFWMQIDKDEQERRFKERMENPDKQWKITEEDWRNRAKWDQYEKAVDEMLLRTSTSYAPWVVVEANDKYYARIKVLETVVNALEKRL
jgi:polyphosphate:AMP phosphotransferase